MRRSRSSTSKVCGFMWLRCSKCFSRAWWSILPDKKTKREKWLIVSARTHSGHIYCFSWNLMQQTFHIFKTFSEAVKVHLQKTDAMFTLYWVTEISWNCLSWISVKIIKNYCFAAEQRTRLTAPRSSWLWPSLCLVIQNSCATLRSPDVPVTHLLTVFLLEVVFGFDEHPQPVQLLPLQLVQLCSKVVLDKVQLFSQFALLQAKSKHSRLQLKVHVWVNRLQNGGSFSEHVPWCHPSWHFSAFLESGDLSRGTRLLPWGSGRSAGQCPDKQHISHLFCLTLITNTFLVT